VSFHWSIVCRQAWILQDYISSRPERISLWVTVTYIDKLSNDTVFHYCDKYGCLVCSVRISLFVLINDSTFYTSVIRQDGSVPIKYGLTLDMEAKYSELKPSLSQLCKIPPQNLLLVDIVQAQFRVSTAHS